MKKEKNGFTLIELLAVIVVLAVIILFAMPAVTNQSEKAKRNLFAQEAGEIIGIAETLYEELSMSGENHQQMCLPIRGMVASGDLKKTVGNLTESNAYQGSVLIDITSGIASYTVWLENGTYKLNNSGTSFSRNDVSLASTDTPYTDGVNTCGGTGTVPAALQKDVKYTTDSTGKTTVTPYNCTWQEDASKCTPTSTT